MTAPLPYELRPNALPWPPMIYIGAIIAAYLIGWIWPLSFGLPWQARAIGIAALGGGLGFDILALLTLRAHRTTFRPDQAATTLVMSGPYALSRNPIYVGNTVALAGMALAFDQPWLLILLLAVVVAVQKLAIEREEKHLSAVFGGTWEAYRRKVRRWV